MEKLDINELRRAYEGVPSYKSDVTTKKFQRSDRGRLLWSLLASAVLNIFIWAAVTSPAHLSFLRIIRAERPGETLIVSTSSLLIKSRTVVRPKHKPKILRVGQAKPLGPRQRPQPTVAAPAETASLSAPRGWAKQNFWTKPATSVTLWVDWAKQSANFVPRLFVWQSQSQAVGSYMRKPSLSLQDAVKDVLSSLRSKGAKLYTSKAQRVCGGAYLGWFFSYVQLSDDPPLHFEETLFIAGDMIHRATYIRPADQSEDTKARKALNTLC